MLQPVEPPRLPGEGPGDDPGHLELAHEPLPGHLAKAVKLLHGDHVHVGRHLEDAVGGGVDDGVARLEVGLPVVADGLRPRVGAVQKPPSHPDGLGPLPENVLGKPVGKGAERLFQVDPHELPVPRGGVLAGVHLPHAAEPAPGPLGAGQGVDPGDPAEAEAGQVGEGDPGLQDRVVQGVRPLVAEEGASGR